MMIHRHSLPRMVLVVLLSILIIILAQPQKIIIDLDISSPLQTRVKVIPSKAYPGGFNFMIRGRSRQTHLIGRVMDGQEVLLEGDPTAASRCVVAVPRGDGSKYIRIMTRWRNAKNNYKRHIDEFIKRPADLYYMQIFRRPIELDIPTQDVGPYINVELLGDWEEHDKRPGVMPDNIETIPMLFTIQPEMAMEVMIGVVRFGHYIVDGHADGLITREVIWEGGLDAPIITILSDYANGLEVEKEYAFVSGEKGFVLYKREIRVARVCD